MISVANVSKLFIASK